MRKLRSRVIVVLDTMWGEEGKGPRFFRINPKNHSGARLYKLIGHGDFWVTNVCPTQVSNAGEHGKPDPSWLATNLQRVDCDLLLVCGKVAQKTFDACGYSPDCRVLRMPHPAARNWTKQMIEGWKRIIQEGDCDESVRSK